ncbi:carboxypeptidase-like regulatory domain-containing protein [Ekhidna sp.]|uniref:carboxypeptidase-like regulatory domain-containing protein n=1 Tax=Ekhidna sp. TaxID=2608089 RepID=UPI0032996665
MSLVSFGIQAQNHILLKGQTRDSTFAPIAFANVIAIDTATQEMKAFAVTDVKGGFQIRLQENTVYEIKVTFVGYVPFSQYMKLDKFPETPLTIIMKEAVNALDEVTVVAEMPVLVRGDTISYKAEAFTKGDERKLEDVLEELPGFAIRDNGDIEVQGKRVDKVLVDGKEFFEGDTKLATKNIPADVVDRVQVLQNFNDIQPMQGLNNDEQLALNIELKSDKKRIVFGDTEAGGGPDNRYFGHANTFYYAPKTSVNFIGDGNNVGALALTLNDYFRMSGGLSSMASRNGTSFRMNAGDAGIPISDRNSASHLTNRLGALNFTTRPTDRFQLSGFLIGFDNDITMGSNSLRTYPQLEDQTQEQLATTSSIGNKSGLGRFSAKYTPNYNLQLDYTFFGKRSTIDQELLRNSQLMSGDNSLQENNQREPSSQSHQVRMFNALNERNIVSAEVNYNEEQTTTNQLLASQLPLFSNFLPNNTLQLSQDQDIISKRIDGAFNYYYILNKTTHINAAVGINRSKQTLISNLADEQEEVVDLDQELNITNRYARIRYRKKWNKLTLSPGVSLNSYTVKGVDESPNQVQYLLPQINARYEFGTSHDIDFSYNQSLEYNDVSAYGEGYRLNGYNTLLFGNLSLDPAFSHNLGLSYRNFNMYNFFNISGGLNYQYIKDGFINNQELSGVENVLTSVNAADANYTTSGYLNLEKRFDHFRVSGMVTVSKSVLNNQIESQLIQNDNFMHQYRLNMSARLFKKLSIRTGYTASINRYSSGSLTNQFVNHRPNIGTTFSYKGFRFETEYAYNKYVNQSQDQETSFEVLDASLSYRKKKSPWEFKVQGLNLLDTRAVRRDSFSDNLISTYSYNIQQRYGLLTIMYDL